MKTVLPNIYQWTYSTVAHFISSCRPALTEHNVFMHELQNKVKYSGAHGHSNNVKRALVNKSTDCYHQLCSSSECCRAFCEDLSSHCSGFTACNLTHLVQS